MSSGAHSTPAQKPGSSVQQPPSIQQGHSSSADSYSNRRAGPIGSLGAAATSKFTATPRNGQHVKKQHKSSRKYRAVDEDDMAESTAVRFAGSRKGQTSITHLMNFELPPRPQNPRLNFGQGRNNRRPTNWGMSSGYSAVDKARYVHANYRFIVDPRGDYHVQSLDADVHLDWSQVLQILVSSESQSTACPICLDVPVAPRMPKCGHIACLPCLMRYMDASHDSQPSYEKKARFRSCPVCSDRIYLSDVRPVRWYAGREDQAPREGEDVVLRLVSRPPGSTLALPHDRAAIFGKDEDVPWYLAPEAMDYARIMKGGRKYMESQCNEDIERLRAQGQEDELIFGGDTLKWTNKAMRSIEEAKGKLEDIGDPPSSPEKPPKTLPTRPPIIFGDVDEAPQMYSIQHAARSGQSMSAEMASHRAASTNRQGETEDPKSSASGPTLEKVDTDFASQSPELKASNTPRPPNASRARHGAPSEYYFYQALRHYYLSPLDIRILKETFGQFSLFPSTILARVEHVSTGHTVDDELRRRTKYLAHLPYGCEVSFLECDWSDTLPSQALDKFRTEIDKRRKRNRDKEAREEKARVRAERTEDELRWASARRRREYSIDKFPDEFQPLPPDADAADKQLAKEADGLSISLPYSSGRQGSSFASLASPSTSPSNKRTVWGTTAIAPTSPGYAPIVQEKLPDDGWLQGWEEELRAEEADSLSRAQALSLAVGEASSSEVASTSPAAKGKKKKGKKITLMNTNIRRGA